jgi:hypothetical protein
VARRCSVRVAFCSGIVRVCQVTLCSTSVDFSKIDFWPPRSAKYPTVRRGKFKYSHKIVIVFQFCLINNKNNGKFRVTRKLTLQTRNVSVYIRIQSVLRSKHSSPLIHTVLQKTPFNTTQVLLISISVTTCFGVLNRHLQASVWTKVYCNTMLRQWYPMYIGSHWLGIIV